MIRYTGNVSVLCFSRNICRVAHIKSSQHLYYITPDWKMFITGFYQTYCLHVVIFMCPTNINSFEQIVCDVWVLMRLMRRNSFKHVYIIPHFTTLLLDKYCRILKLPCRCNYLYTRCPRGCSSSPVVRLVRVELYARFLPEVQNSKWGFAASSITCEKLSMFWLYIDILWIVWLWVLRVDYLFYLDVPMFARERFLHRTRLPKFEILV